MTPTNELQVIRLRLEKLEALVRPLLTAQAAGRSSDDRILAALADQVGVDAARLQGDERTRGVTAARRVVARTLHTEAGWTIGRIARVMRKDHRSTRAMVG